MNFKWILLLLMTLGSAELSYSTDDVRRNQQGAQTPGIELCLFCPDDINLDPKLKPLLEISPNYEKYYFRFTGCPINKEIIVYLRRLVQDQLKYNGQPTYEVKGKFSIREDGAIMIGDQVSPTYFWFSSYGYAPGERVNCRFQTADGELDKELSWIPIPMIAYDKTRKVSLEAELALVHPTCYQVSLKGLEKGENYRFRSKSADEIIEEVRQFTGEIMLYSPGTLSLKGGQSEMSIITKSTGVIKLHFPWGKKIADYIVGPQIYKP